MPVRRMRSNDFDGLLRSRATALLKRIEDACGKSVTGRDSEETVRAFGAPPIWRDGRCL